LNQRQRTKIGARLGLFGIICNTLLSLGKLAAGFFSGSMSIAADGLNNLSDAASSVVTVLAFKLAEKPADKQHPYGHARFEYLASLTVSMLILVIGFELVKSSVQKILSPTPVMFSPVLLWTLFLSIAVKLMMMICNRRMGQKIQSKVLLAAAVDSRNDALTTCAILAAALVQEYTGILIDGAMGLLVSFFILASGISMAKDTISPLLGEGADPELQNQLTGYISSCPMVLGCHDLMVHDYGPGRCYASIHVEMDQRADPLECHTKIDKMERECFHRFGVHMVIHLDPIAVNDPETDRLRKLVTTILKVRDPRLELHDFRLIPKPGQTKLVFDLIVPEDLQNQKEEIQSALEQALEALEPERYCIHITFDL